MNENVIKAVHYLYSKYAILNSSGKTLFENPEAPPKTSNNFFIRRKKKNIPIEESTVNKIINLDEEVIFSSSQEGSYVINQSINGIQLANFYMDVALTGQENLDYLVFYKDPNKNFPESTLIRVEEGKLQPLASLLVGQEGSWHKIDSQQENQSQKRKINLGALEKDLQKVRKTMKYATSTTLAIINSELGNQYPRIFNVGQLASGINNAGLLFENIITKYSGAKELLQTVGQSLWEGKMKRYSGFCIMGWSPLVQERFLD